MSSLHERIIDALEKKNPMYKDITDISIEVASSWDNNIHHKFTPEMVKPLIMSTVDAVQKHTTEKYGKVDGAHKKEIALSVLDQMLQHLNSSGAIDADQYEMIKLGVSVFAGPMIDLAKQVWKSIHAVAEDIHDNGASGCCLRNCK